MEVVPQIRSQFNGDVKAILFAADRDNLPVLNPGSGFGVNLDKTTDTFKEFDFKLYCAFTDILRDNWVHAWPTYRFIPFHNRKQWFLTLARQYTWDRRHTFTVWKQFNLVVRQVYRAEIRHLIWKRRNAADKPEWMNKKVWKDFLYIFREILF